MAILTVLLLVYAGAMTWYSWADEKEESVRALMTITELEATAIDRYFKQLEIGLKGLAEDLTRNGERLDLDEAYLLVKRFKELHPELLNVTLIQPDGAVLLTAKTPPGTTNATLAKETSFIKFIDELKQGQSLAIGQPLIGVVSAVVNVPMRYAIRDRQGNLSYIVSANLTHEHLRSFWIDAPIGAQAAIGLMRDNGYLLSRYPVPANLTLAQVYGQPRTGALINYLNQSGFPQQGYVQGPSSLDGPDFLNVFRRLPNYPVTLFAAMPMSEIREGWFKRIRATYVALLFLLMGGFGTYRNAVRRQLAWNLEQARLEGEREEALARLRKLASQVPGIVFQFRLRPDGTFCLPYVNDAICRIYRVTPDDVREDAAPIFARVHPDDLPAFLDSIQASGRDLTPWHHEYRLKFDAEPDTWLLGDAMPEREEHGSVLWHGFITEITERMQAETTMRQAIDEQTAIFESATSGIAFIKNRVIVKGNRTLDRLFGYEPGEQVGLTTRRWYPDDEAFALGGTPYPALARGDTHQREQELLRKDGTKFWCRLSGSAIEAADLSRGTVWMLTDVTHEHETVEALQQAKDAAEVANLAKSRFLATMSHEIRTPMNGILGMAQMLLSPRLDDTARQDYARTVFNSGQTLLTLLNDILDLSKVEAGKIVLEATAFEPAQILQETRALFAETAASKGLAIEAGEFTPPSQRYLGDPYRLRQMLSNLTNNAVKFTRQGKINIEAQEIGREGQFATLEFSVTDTGIGIPEDKRQLLFQPFSQTDSSTTRQYGGSGLGLSIVSSLAKLMVGEVGVDSQPGTGSRFWFRMNARLVVAGRDSRHDTRSPQSGSTSEISPLSGRVLVAEDVETNRQVALALLHKIGLTVVFAEDGQQALDAVVQGDPADLILMDVQMPVMDGYGSTERIRQWEEENGRPRRPIIALTADAFEADRQKCLAAGMDDFIAKPMAVNTLREVLGRWLPTDPAANHARTKPSVDLKPLDVDRVVAILKELEPLLTHHQFDSIRCFKALQAVAAGTGIAAEMDEAARLLSEFRFHETLDSLRRLAAAHHWEITS